MKKKINIVMWISYTQLAVSVLPLKNTQQILNNQSPFLFAPLQCQKQVQRNFTKLCYQQSSLNPVERFFDVSIHRINLIAILHGILCFHCNSKRFDTVERSLIDPCWFINRLMHFAVDYLINTLPLNWFDKN